MPNPIVYFEIAGKDRDTLEDFYRAAFDWKFMPAGDNYSHISPGAGINGGIGQSVDGDGHATFYVEVANITDTLTVVESRGGERIMGPEHMPNGPLVAMFSDPEGRIVGLIQANSLRNG